VSATDQSDFLVPPRLASKTGLPWRWLEPPKFGFSLLGVRPDVDDEPKWSE
jgi:hypothetical protein